MITPGTIFGITIIIAVLAITVPIALIIGKGIYSFLGGEFIGEKINHELCTRIKADITSIGTLHNKIKQNLVSCTEIDKKYLRKECGHATVEAFL